jgi:alpha-amylase
VREITLVLVVHDHQPVGNFDGVIAQAVERAYRPFLAFLEGHPAVRLGLHTSGPLLEWLEAHDPGYLDRLRALVARGQVEPWGGGFYEPVLAAIPEPDRQGQIAAMADWLERRLGRRPRGLWLTERVWEPALAGTLADAGVEYTAADDAHFVAGGLERDELFGWFLTEDQGKRVGVFPIHRELRYLSPFRPVSEMMAWLGQVADGGEGRLVFLGDDGEKLGVWPGTHELCYVEGWLEQFAATVEAAGFVRLLTPAEALARHAPLGVVYLPTASYHELGEWALPPSAQHRYHEAAEVLKPRFGESAADLLRGGHWRGFLHRYPEANRLQQRMLRASRRLWSRPRPREEGWRQACASLWRAQCNDAYWHGIFGGLYLPHLRAAVYRELVAAERALCGRGVQVEAADLDLDGAEEVLLESPALAAWVAPAQGGALFALDDRVRCHAYGDTLARRPEAYHARLAQARVGGGEGETIHAAVRAKEAGLATLLRYDTLPRFSFLDHFAPGPGAPPDRDPALARRAYRVAGRRGAALELELDPLGGAVPLRVRKRYALEGAAGNRLAVAYTLANPGPGVVEGAFTVECNWAVQVPRAADRHVEVDGRRADPPHFAAQGEHAGCRRLAFVDGWAGRRLEVRWSVPGLLRRAPVETVSLSETGAERVFQAAETQVSWPLRLGPGERWKVAFEVEAGAAAGAAP